MKLKIFGCFINFTVIWCQHELYLAISRHDILGVVMCLLETRDGSVGPVSWYQDHFTEIL